MKNKKFNKLKNLLKSKQKATSELEASNNPMQYLKTHKNMSIKKLKGVAI